jgi:hypothetical protein
MVELSDGRRVPGTALGHFREARSDQKYRPRAYDLGVIRLDENRRWPAAAIGNSASQQPGALCLAIGFPGVIKPGQPPLLRLGRMLPPLPDGTLRTSCRVLPGDSGGPALDSAGRVMGVASRGDASCQAALYGNVSSWKDLIVSTAIDAATAGGYSPPSWTGTTSMDGGAPDGDIPAEAGPGDSGTDPPDSGTPEEDSGVTDPPDSGAGVVGEPCEGTCSGGLVCYQPNEDNNDGICVPECTGTNDRSCPGGYVCNGRLAVCVPKVPDTTKDSKGSDDEPHDSGGCGCHTAARPDGHAAWVLAFLPLALALRRGRRERVVG